MKDARAFFDDGKMEIEIGSIVDSPYISARWEFIGAYTGGMPDAKAEVGEIMSFNGMDILEIENGKIKSYWVSSNGVYLMEQLVAFFSSSFIMCSMQSINDLRTVFEVKNRAHGCLDS
nr:ester cyclase [Salicibibacter cibarius]